MSSVFGFEKPRGDAGNSTTSGGHQASVMLVDGLLNAGLAVVAYTPAMTKRIIADGGVTYIGEARPGTAADDALWRIQRVTVDGDSTIIEWALNAEGRALFDQVWDNGEEGEDHLDYTDLTYG